MLFAAIQDVFIAGDLLWYHIQANKKCCAPDIMVVFGRLKGYRGSYVQCQEGNIAPQVVFEILSPSNNKEEMDMKRDFYEKYGVEEYYLYDPETNNLQGWTRANKSLVAIAKINGWTSPRLKIRFVLTTTLEIYRPDGRLFLTPVEIDLERQLEKQKREEAEEQLELERQRYQELLRQLKGRGIEL
jgi:Uma2 family endonuclease